MTKDGAERFKEQNNRVARACKMSNKKNDKEKEWCRPLTKNSSSTTKNSSPSTKNSSPSTNRLSLSPDKYLLLTEREKGEGEEGEE